MPDLFGLGGAGQKVVDEAAKDLPQVAAQLEPELQRAIDYLVAKLESVLVGRTITITIE